MKTKSAVISARPLIEGCRVLLPFKSGIYVVITCLESLLSQMQQQNPNQGIERIEITNNRWMCLYVGDSLNEDAEGKIENNEATLSFSLPRGISITKARTVIRVTIRRLYHFHKARIEEVDQISCKDSTITIKVKATQQTRLERVSSNEVRSFASKEKFLLLDGSNFLNRAFYVTSDNDSEHLMQTSEGLYTNAVFTFIEMFSRLLKKYSPTHVCVAWDESREKTFRRKRYPDYKGNRPETDPRLREQYGTVQDLLKEMNIPQISVDEYEADDVIGTLSRKWNKEKEGCCYIVSNDRDLFQLLHEKTVQVIRDQRRNVDKEFTVHEFKQKFGISPFQWPSVKGLLGDKGDNLPGCLGVGEVGALALIQQYETLENVYENLESISLTPLKKYKQKLINGKGMLYCPRI